MAIQLSFRPTLSRLLCLSFILVCWCTSEKGVNLMPQQKRGCRCQNQSMDTKTTKFVTRSENCSADAGNSSKDFTYYQLLFGSNLKSVLAFALYIICHIIKREYSRITSGLPHTRTNCDFPAEATIDSIYPRHSSSQSVLPSLTVASLQTLALRWSEWKTRLGWE